MIKYNLNNINDWNFGEDNIIKVYRNNAVCYYKIDTSSPSGQTPCFAVVDNISQYSDTEFEDVFNLADEKWYKLNNLNLYEEYGVYGSGRNITYYEGKLTVDDGYEYEWNGSSWVNLGEVSGSTITIKSPEYIERTSSYNGYCSLLEYLTEDTKLIIKHKQTTAGGGRIIGDYNSNDSDDWRFFFYGSTLYYDFITQRKSTIKSMPMSAAEEWEVGNYYIKNTANDTYYISSTTQTFSSRPSPLYIYHSDGVGAGESGTDYGQIWYIKIYKNNVLVRDFIPWTDMNGNYGLYDKVENELVHTVGNMTASTVINDVEIGGGGQPIYPLEYVVREDPPDNVTFTSMTEAEDYECPWVGMKATIDGSGYTFSGDSQSGYEWVYIPSRLPQGYTEVEYVENTSTAYIDTGAYLDTSNFEIGYVIGNKQQLFGYCHQGCGSCTWLGVEQSATMWWGNFNNNANISSYLTSGDNTIIFTQSGATINGISISKTLSIGSDNISNISLPIFARYDFKNNIIEHRTDSYMQLKSFYLKNNGTLVRDFVPAKRDSDNKYGMYDIVNDVFYVSPNNVDFSGGEPV